MGDYATAEPLYQRALKIYEKALGPDHPSTAISLNNLAQLHVDMGDYAIASPLLQRALQINEKALGPDHPGTATNLNNLANLYVNMGDYARAEPLDQRALKIYEKALGPEHPDTASALVSLALLYDYMGDYAKAEPLYERALEINEKALGPDHPITAISLNNLAALYKNMGDYAKAEPLYQRALRIREKALGAEHPDTAVSLNSLALSYEDMGDYAKAEPLFQRALKINEKMLGPDHPHTAISLYNLAELYFSMGDPKGALRLAAQVRRAQEKNLSDILSFTSEQQRLAFQKTTNPYTLPGTLGNAPELAETVLRQKGVVLDSLLEDRLVAEASGDPRQREIIEQLRAAKQRLTQLQLESTEGFVRTTPETARGRKRKTLHGSRATRRKPSSSGGGLGPCKKSVERHGPASSISSAPASSIDRVVALFALSWERQSEPRYGAIVIGTSGEPSWVPLGNAAEIEKNVGLYQKSVRGKTDEATLSGVLTSCAINSGRQSRKSYLTIQRPSLSARMPN